MLFLSDIIELYAFSAFFHICICYSNDTDSHEYTPCELLIQIWHTEKLNFSHFLLYLLHAISDLTLA